jgi:hypothetical protein
MSSFSSRPGHGRPSKQFPESSEAFSGCGERFHEIAMTENGGGKERKINSESGERWAERAEVKVFAKRQRHKKLFKHATSPKSLAPVIDAFRKSCIYTSYLTSGEGNVCVSVHPSTPIIYCRRL